MVGRSEGGREVAGVEKKRRRRGGKERLQREREGGTRVIMLRGSTVPRWRDEEIRLTMKGEGRRYPPSLTPYVRLLLRRVSGLFLSQPVARFPSLARSFRGDKERNEEKDSKRGEQREVRKTCPSLHDPVHSTPTVLTITLEERAGIAKRRAETPGSARSLGGPGGGR